MIQQYHLAVDQDVCEHGKVRLSGRQTVIEFCAMEALSVKLWQSQPIPSHPSITSLANASRGCAHASDTAERTSLHPLAM